MRWNTEKWRSSMIDVGLGSMPASAVVASVRPNVYVTLRAPPVHILTVDSAPMAMMSAMDSGLRGLPHWKRALAWRPR